jgi:ribosomal-protein-alanine N-acetyltransferase
MEIEVYSPIFKSTCEAIFKSNMPPYFAPHEFALFENFLEKNELPFWVIKDDKKILGCGGIYFDKEKQESRLSWGMVDLIEHGKGYGRELLHFRIDHAKKDHPSFKVISQTSQHTYGFFEKEGFTLKYVKNDYWAEGLHLYHMELG